jgi:lipid-A-disaccharide synthase
VTRQIFVSAGEPSGDIHAANLIRAMTAAAPSLSASGFGGPRMAAAGCSIRFPLVEHPIMGLAGAARALPLMRRLLREFDAQAAADPPDAVVLVDYPGFNMRLAEIAHRRGVPVFYHVPPQIWAWGSWRVHRLARCVDEIFCTLPFEEAWYRTRGVKSAHYVGHPFFDDLALWSPQGSGGSVFDDEGEGRRVVLLPGSRLWEAKRNLRVLFASAEKLACEAGRLDLHVAAFNESIAAEALAASRATGAACRIHVQRTRELLAGADLAIAVSGSVSLELLHFEVPSVIVYRAPWHWQHVLRPLLLHAPHVTLVNLIAGRRIFPEFVGSGDLSGPVAAAAARILLEPGRRAEMKRKLAWLKRAYAAPGASAAAAERILDRLSLKRRPLPAAA